MPDKNDDKTNDKAAEGAVKSKKPLLIAIGAVIAIAVGAGGAMMAVPKKPEPTPRLEGPFVAKLSKGELQVNLAGEASKRYLVMSLRAEYFAYDERYVAARLGIAADGTASAAKTEDPLYMVMLQDAMLRLAATKTRDQVTDPQQMDAFLEDIRRAVDPLLFPVCVGDSHAQTSADTKSGLRVGESVMESTLRGMLHENVVVIDAAKSTVSLNDGTPVRYDTTQRDLLVKDKSGNTVYLDVTGLNPEFSGEVPVGRPGRVRKIYREQILVQ